MSIEQSRWPRLLGWIIIGLGIALFAGYWVYLPMRERLLQADHADPGMILYALATAGSAFVAWGMLLRGISVNVLPRAQVLRASAAGFALLGVMRLGTVLFPHGPFAQMMALPAVECVVFAVLALALFRSA